MGEEYSYEEYQSYLNSELDRIFSGRETVPNILNYQNDVVKEEVKNDKRTIYSDIENYHEGIRWESEKKDYFTRTYYGYDENNNKVITVKDAYLVGSFHEGLAWVRYKNGGCNYIDKEGNIAFSIPDATKVYDFHNGFAIFEKNNKMYFINHYGVVSKNGYTAVDNFENGLAVVRFGNFYNVIDENYNYVHRWEMRVPSIHESYNFRFINNTAYLKHDYLNDYQIKKTILGYECVNLNSKTDGNKLRVKYKPVKIYFDKYVLCISNRCILYLYDSENNRYTIIDSAKWVEFNDDFILSRAHFYGDKNTCFVAYLVYDEGIVDITDYYNKNLKNKEYLGIIHGYGRVLTYPEFVRQDEKLGEMEEVGKVFGKDTLHRRRF